MCAFTNVAIGSDIRSNDQSCYRAHSLVFFVVGPVKVLWRAELTEHPSDLDIIIAIITSSSTIFFHLSLRVKCSASPVSRFT